MNKQTAYRFVIENANTDLLPLDLDPMVPDNQILSVGNEAYGRKTNNYK